MRPVSPVHRGLFGVQNSLSRDVLWLPEPYVRPPLIVLRQVVTIFGELIEALANMHLRQEDSARLHSDVAGQGSDMRLPGSEVVQFTGASVPQQCQVSSSRAPSKNSPFIHLSFNDSFIVSRGYYHFAINVEQTHVKGNFVSTFNQESCCSGCQCFRAAFSWRAPRAMSQSPKVRY